MLVKDETKKPMASQNFEYYANGISNQTHMVSQLKWSLLDQF